MMLVVGKQNEINCDVFFDQCPHRRVTLGGNTERFTTNDGLKLMALDYAKCSV